MDWKYLERVKWANDCQSCGIHINVNDHAYWKKDIGIRHTYCIVTSVSGISNEETSAIIKSDTIEELQENISTRSFDVWSRSKKKRVQITFPRCQKCGKKNDVPALELCEQCEINNVVSDVDRNKRGNARRIIRAFRRDPKIRYHTYTPEIMPFLSISDGGDRYKAIEKFGFEVGLPYRAAFLILIDQLDGILIDRSKRGNELLEVDMFQPRNAKILRYRDPTTDENYACFVPTHIYRADEAMAWKFFLTEEEYDGMRVEA